MTYGIELYLEELRYQEKMRFERTLTKHKEAQRKLKRKQRMKFKGVKR